MALARDVTGGEAGFFEGRLVFLGAGVDTVRLLVQQTEKPGRLDVGLGPDAVLGQEDDPYRAGRFRDDLRRCGVEPFVGPSFERIDILLTKGASTCPP